MARYMRLAGENPSIPEPQATTRSEGPTHIVEQVHAIVDEASAATNNAGTGAVGGLHTSQSVPGIDTHELMKRSNQLAERFNQLLERSNELVERCSQTPADQSGSQPFTERFNQVLERLTQLIEQSHQPAERTDRLTERFNELFERFNQLTEQSHQPARRANELADRANQIAEKLIQSSERSNQLAELAVKPVEKLEDLLKNINRVLVGIQHAVVRAVIAIL
ncbi:hypothetical protein FRC11_005754 [Ceratobasidium sp. 423]|nr:hypothetical protein FRC11_005754 [Ceratobasidium sp. 423]